MRVKQLGTWKALILILAGLSCLLPLAGSAARERAAGALAPRPDRWQFEDYTRGIEGWSEALRETAPDRRMAAFECAESHFLSSLSGPGNFPEAKLALALLYYTRNSHEGRLDPDAYRAEWLLKDVVQSTQGAIRAEALTYLGVLALRCRHWQMAREQFDLAMQTAKEDWSASTFSVTGKEREKLIAIWHERVNRLECVNRAGSVLATFYMADTPAFPGDEAYRSVLDQINRLLSPEQVARCASAFNGSDAPGALWRFPELPPPSPLATGIPPIPLPQPDWRYVIWDPRPENVEAISLQEFVQSIRIWAGAELGPSSPESLPPAAGLKLRERKNLAAGLLRRLLDAERRGDWTTALQVCDRLAELSDIEVELFPDGPRVLLPITARQHRIWIRLNYIVDLADARRLTDGPGAAEDPDIWDERFTLAERYVRAGNTTAAAEQLRVIINGSPTAREPQSRARQERVLRLLRPLAEWNIRVIALNMASRNVNPNTWLDLLANLPNTPSQETLRFYTALRLAEAYVRQRNPAQAEEWLRRAEASAAIRSGPSVVPGGQDLLPGFRRYLASIVFEMGEENRYRNGFLTRTSYGAELRAYEAYELYLRSRPQNPAGWQPVLDRLQDALRWADGNADLRRRLEGDIAKIRRFMEGGPPAGMRGADYERIAQLVRRWNEAADLTWNSGPIPLDAANRPRALEAWKTALDKWSGILRDLPEGAMLPRVDKPPMDDMHAMTDREEAALHVVRSHMKIADVYYAAGDRRAASAALRDAIDALGRLPLNPRDREILVARINQDAQALGPNAPRAPVAPAHGMQPPMAAEDQLAPGPGRFTPYRDGPLRAVTNAWAVARNPKRQMPDVERWLQRIRTDAEVRRQLVHWFNEGPVARSLAAKGYRVKRDFSADLDSPNSLVAFLEKNVSRTPGLLRRGTLQWAMRPGHFGDWRSSRVHLDEASYNLKNGVALVNAACSNPITVIVLAGPRPPVIARRPGWTYYHDCPMWRHLPDRPTPPPMIALDVYSRPDATWSWAPVEQYGYAWAPWIPSSLIVGPGITLLARAWVMPGFAVSWRDRQEIIVVPDVGAAISGRGGWVSGHGSKYAGYPGAVPGPLPPLCSPTRITIGRISSINDWQFPLAVYSGTPENRRRRDALPEERIEPSRSNPR